MRSTPLQWIVVLLTAALWPIVSFSQINPATLTKAGSAQVGVVTTYKSYNRVSGEAVYEVAVSNVSSGALRGPVYVVLESLSGAGVTVKNAAGVASSGGSYYVLSSVQMGAGVTLKQSVLLGNPSNVRVSFTAVVYSTPAPAGPLTVVITKPATLIT